MIARILSVLPFVLLLTGCQPEVAAEPPAPVAMNAQAVGHYCQMDVLEHEGPKAQIHVANLDRPLWFSQIRDAVAFTKLPEETDEVLAIYVNDMAKANSWASRAISRMNSSK